MTAGALFIDVGLSTGDFVARNSGTSANVYEEQPAPRAGCRSPTRSARKIDLAGTRVRHTAVRVASGEPLVIEVAMAKNTDAEGERHHRDARIAGIRGGTTEIRYEIIATQLGV